MKTLFCLAVVVLLHVPAHAQQFGGGGAGPQQSSRIEGLRIDGLRVDRADSLLNRRTPNEDAYSALLEKYGRSRETDILREWNQSNIRIPDHFTPAQNTELKRKLHDLQNVCPSCSTGVIIGGGTPQVVVKPPPSSQPLVGLPSGVMVSLSYADYQRMLKKEVVFDRLSAKGCALDAVRSDQKVIQCAN